MGNDLEGGELLEKFVEKMMTDKGVEVDEKEKARLIEVLDEEIDKEMLRAMPEKSFSELEQAFDSGASDERVSEIIEGSGVKMEEVVSKTMDKFKNKYLEGEK